MPVAEIDPASDWCQRWTAGHQSWRPKSAGGFDPRDDYEVAALARDTDARAFLSSHHYLRGYPAALVRLGLYHGPLLVGIAVFSAPMSNRVLTNAFPELVPNAESMELGRFCLVDAVPGNGESWFLGQCFRELASRGVRGIVSFADPTPRATPDGHRFFGGHIGTIYQATNFLPAGRGTARVVNVLPDGSVFTQREEQKLRAGDQGQAYVRRKLLALGAPRQLPGEDVDDWLRRTFAALGVRKQRERGKFRYVQRIGPWRRYVRIGLPLDPVYPKAVDELEWVA